MFLNVIVPFSLFFVNSRPGRNPKAAKIGWVLAGRFVEIHLSQGQGQALRQERDGMESLLQGVGVVAHLDQEAQLPHMLVVSARLHPHVPGEAFFDVPQVLRQFGGQGIWIPDFSVCHTDGRVAHVEVLGFWRTDYLNRRLKLLQKAPQNLILVISDKLKLSDGQLEKTGIQIVMFKRTPRFQDVLAAAEKCACPEKTDISQS